MHRRGGLVALAALGLALAAGAPCGWSQPSPAFDVTMKPVRDGGGEVAAIEVRSTLRGTPAGKPFVIQAPVVYAGVRGVADRVKELAVSDAAGDVPLAMAEDPPAPGGFPYYRHWTAQRPVSGPVTIRYRSLVQPPEQTHGPPFGIRPSGGGVSGAGAGFLVLPEHTGAMDLHLAWDVSGLAAGSVGIDSFGEGEVRLHDDPSRLSDAWYMVGPVGRYPAQGDADGFSAAWLGRVPFDPVAEMRWTGRLYAFLGRSFRYLDPPPRYRVFMRFLETPPVGGGTALPKSFMLSAPAGDPRPDAHAPHNTLAHEMIHQWTGGIDAPQGISSWFSEGLTVYYTALLPKRGGFASLDDYARDINAIAKGYWAFPARDWSAARIAEAGFGSEDIRHIPYDRSALYFADLDAKIRAKSHGRRRLEDALQPIFRSRAQGVRFDHEAWKAFVTREIGPGAVSEWRRVVIDGGLFVPDVHAFGPCFELKPTRYDFQGKPLEGYEWVRVAGVADAACRAW